MAPPSSLLSDPRPLLAELQQLRQAVLSEGETTLARWQPLIRRRSFRASALNLAHYLALRKRDIRPLQQALMPWGLSSLGRSEGRVLPNLDAVIDTLGALCQAPASALPPRPLPSAFFRGERCLRHNTRLLLGQAPAERAVRIMVTLPTEAASDPGMLRGLLEAGMNCARINCAHDDPRIWAAMIARLRQTQRDLGRSCQVLMDLAGPKIRTEQVTTPLGQERLFRGDRLLLVRGQPPVGDHYSFQASCTHPVVLDHLQVGSAVWLDEGRLGCRVEALGPQGAVLQVTVARPKGEKLRPGKGLNFPDVELPLQPLTSKDLLDLDFVAAHTDLVGYSFVQRPADLDLLIGELQGRAGARAGAIGIVAKIETAHALCNLPELIARAAGRQPFGVMIARGDLAVEISFPRLAEIQEEILWVCEAAHIPVIWATQVLENLSQKGIPSRAEITDAAMAERAECVMLNKGPYVTEAVRLLDDVLRRMEAHQRKKTSQLRALRLW